MNSRQAENDRAAFSGKLSGARPDYNYIFFVMKIYYSSKIVQLDEQL